MTAQRRRRRVGGLAAGVLACVGAGAIARDDPPRPVRGADMLPRTTAPIIYTINYSGQYFRDPDYIEQFRAAPPDLLHVGKAVPISHHWGPIRLFQGENQYTGGPGHTLSRENIALLSPAALARRIETLRRTLDRYHAIGIREITPYISYHTLAGDHQKRLGFWKFYDQWAKYARWAGPRPKHDPFDWLVVDVRGKFVGGSCGGYSPKYYAPLHRYRACINHPDWCEWHRRLIRMVAEVGYDGCFIDNTHPDPCYCRYCRASFRQFLKDNADTAWVRRMTGGLDDEKLTLGSPDVPGELVRRWRLTRTRDHLGMLREAGRKVRGGFTLFPNSGRLDDCLLVGAKCDRLMVESTYAPGILSADVPPQTQAVSIEVTADAAPAKRIVHRFSLGDARTFMEMEADISLPTKARVGRPVALEVKVISVGASRLDGDAAEEFHLLLRRRASGEKVRLDLAPAGAIGGTGSSRKPRQPPATLKATWTPKRSGRYEVLFGFRYTDDSHRKQADRRLHLARLRRQRTCRTHMPELLFTQHMRARTIHLGYDARRKGWENVQELSLAEMAAFSGGGGFSGRGGPQAKYRAFFKKHADLFDGWMQTAPAAVLYAHWGPNPLGAQRPWAKPTVHAYLAETHRLFVALVDRTFSDKPFVPLRAPQRPADLASFRVVYLGSPAYELAPGQLAALRCFFEQGGRVVLADKDVLINGRPAAQLLKRTVAVATGAQREREIRRGPAVWDWDVADRMASARHPTALDRAAWSEMIRTPAIAPADGLRRNVRFALYRKGDKLALHAVNYNVCLLDKRKQLVAVPPTTVQVPLPAGWTAVKATCFDPDAEPQGLPCTLADGRANLSLPPMRIYKIVLIERKMRP